MKHLIFRLMPLAMSLVLCSPQTALAAVSAEEFLAVKPAVIRLFGCENIGNWEIRDETETVVFTALRLDRDSSAVMDGKKSVYQTLPFPIEIKGVTLEKVLISDNAEMNGYTFKLASPADLQKIRDGFKMKKQTPTILKGDSIYRNVFPGTEAERQASVNPKKLTYTCRWRSEAFDDEVE